MINDYTSLKFHPIYSNGMDNREDLFVHYYNDDHFPKSLPINYFVSANNTVLIPKIIYFRRV